MLNVPTAPGASKPPVVQPPSQPNQSDFTRLEIASILSTLGLTLGLAIFAGVASQHYDTSNVNIWSLYLAAAVGALGGLAHEIAQSGGKILFFERRADGFYIGSLAGIVLGAVAGILSARLLFTDPHPTMSAAQLTYETFLAGLALKGVVEAAGGQAVGLTTNQPAPIQPLGSQQQLQPPPARVPLA